ncbi:MAG TPA: hypothetical protein VNH18_02410, partial [Bryobacteraceae bacterium]|nr:hypothetical protein [Bryobacteraceae bacterium]
NYRVTLKPVKGSPSFAANREVAAKVDEDEVRVELVEDAVSHRRIVDVLKLSTETPIDPMNSLIQFHNHIFRMVHGK